jgi:hypothetical protein
MRVSATAVVIGVCLGGFSACAADTDPFTVPESEAEQYSTAYLSRVVPAPEGDDLAEGGGEFVVIEQNADIRVDMGGWYIEDSDGNRLSLGIGRQIDPGAELRVHSSCGESTEAAVYACAETEVLDDEGDVLTLRDSAGGDVATFAYGDERQ